MLRVPSRKRDLIELIPDVELTATVPGDADALAHASLALAPQVLVAEDFSDWEKH